MNLPTLIYCSRCQEPVKPVKGIVIYLCPECGAPFVGYRERISSEETREIEPEQPLSELAVA